MRLAAHQPHYLPWLGYLDKIASADVFCLMDTIAFEQNSFQHRNKIRISNDSGEIMLTLPVPTTGEYRIMDVPLINNMWRDHHVKLIREAYSKAPYFTRYTPLLDDIYSHDSHMLCDIADRTMQAFVNAFGIKTRIVRASEFNIYPGAPTNIHVALCNIFGAKEYIAGGGVCKYLNEQALAGAGIKLTRQQFVHPVYKQIHGAFMPRMAALDLLMNCGQESAQMLRS